MIKNHARHKPKITPTGLAFLIEHPERLTRTLDDLPDAEIRAAANATSDELARYRAMLTAAGASTVPTTGWIERIHDSITRRHGLLERLFQEIREREQSPQARGRRENGYIREASNA